MRGDLNRTLALLTAGSLLSSCLTPPGGCPCPASGLPDEVNLLRNGDFENELRHWQVAHPARWAESGGFEASGAILMNAPAAPEDRSIHEVTASQCVEIGDAREFSLDARFRYESLPEKGMGHRLHVYWYEDTRCSRRGQYGFYLEPELAEGWQYLSRANIRPTLDARSAKVVLTQNQRSSARREGRLRRAWVGIAALFGADRPPRLSSAYWDDLSLFPTAFAAPSPPRPAASGRDTLPVGENYVRNGSFDRDAEKWLVYAKGGWTSQEGHEKPGALLTTIETTTSGLGTGVFHQCVNFGGRRAFEMGVSFKRSEESTQAGGGRFRVTWYEDDDCRGRHKIDPKHADPEPAEGWQQLSVTGLRAPLDTRSAKVTMIQSIKGPGVFSVYWDDAYFRATAE